VAGRPGDLNHVVGRNRQPLPAQHRRPSYGVSGLFADLGNNGVHGLNEQVGGELGEPEFLYRLVKRLAARPRAAMVE
jgi:hypothetical protein